MVSLHYDALLIRLRKQGLETTYVVFDAMRVREVAGPFATLHDAVEAAAGIVGPSGSVWQETADLRARPLDVHALRTSGRRD